MIQETANTPASRHMGAIIKGLVLLVIIAGLVLATRYFNLPDLLRDVLKYIDESGPVGSLVFFLLYVLASVFMVPAAILTLGAGAVFGVVKGSILVSLSSTAGAAAAFLVGRYLARDTVSRRVQGNPKFKSVDDAVAVEGWKIVGLTRLSPVFPFNLLNYIFGLTSVPFGHFVLASWIGMMPGTVMYVYWGSLAGTLAEIGLGQGREGRSAAEWILYGVGLVTTIILTVIITRIARRALGKKIDIRKDGSNDDSNQED